MDDLALVKNQIEQFRKMFRENPIKEMQEGTWFTKLLQRLITDHAAKVNGDYFKKKYIGLNNENIANQLTKTTANYAAIAGGITAAAASAAELSEAVSAGATTAAVVVSLIGEISYISYLQLKLVYDISIVCDARLDKDDPEDILTIFWAALGVNIWEDVSSALLKAGPRSAEYLGRKALRAGVRKAMVSVATRLGGAQLAKKITEKALLKLIVPGVNIPITALADRSFTKVLGKKAITTFKSRGVAIRIGFWTSTPFRLAGNGLSYLLYFKWDNPNYNILCYIEKHGIQQNNGGNRAYLRSAHDDSINSRNNRSNIFSRLADTMVFIFDTYR